jgi:hypothetical protein
VRHKLLAKNGIQVDEKEASIILEFLYLMAKAYNQNDGCQNDTNLNEKIKPRENGLEIPTGTAFKPEMKIV